MKYRQVIDTVALGLSIDWHSLKSSRNIAIALNDENTMISLVS
jgi:hypothetical protein